MAHQSFEFEIKDVIITCMLAIDVVATAEPDVGFLGEIEITDCEVLSIEFPDHTIENDDMSPDRQEEVNSWVYDWIMENRYEQVCEEYGE